MDFYELLTITGQEAIHAAMDLAPREKDFLTHFQQLSRQYPREIARGALETAILSINRHIGRRPIATFGSSDGDLQMIQWTISGPGARFALIVHHTDAEREYAYDRETSIGRLDKALDAAKERGWTVVDMHRDWKRVFPVD